MRMIVKLSVDGLQEGIIYRDRFGIGYILSHCVICGKPRPVRLRHGQPASSKCQQDVITKIWSFVS